MNLFTPSEVSWKVQGVPAKLIQTTTYPESDSSELRVEVAAPMRIHYLRAHSRLAAVARATRCQREGHLCGSRVSDLCRYPSPLADE